MDREDFKLKTFKIANVDVYRYLDADSDDTWIINEFVKYVKSYVLLEKAPVLLSQAHLLFAAPLGKLGKGST